MAIQFTSDARPPSGTQLLPNRFLRPAFGELYGFDADADEAVDGAITTELSEPLTTELGDILQFEPVGGAPAFNTYSVDFDGTNDYMDCGAVSALNSTASFTISMWVNFQNVTGSTAMSIFTSGTSFSDRIEFVFNISNELRFGVNTSLTNCVLNISSPTDYRSTNAWHNILGTYDGTNVTLFFDGSQVATTTTSVPSTTSSTHGNNTTIGRRTLGGSGLYFNGLIDEVAIWDSELSASDITSIYNSGIPADLSSLSPVHSWRMGDNDGGTGTTITDQGSGGNDGTLTNGPTFSTTVPS